jgi:hypothetical protein
MYLYKQVDTNHYTFVKKTSVQNGQFKFSDLNAGSYYIRAASSGYTPSSKIVSVNTGSDSSTSFSLSGVSTGTLPEFNNVYVTNGGYFIIYYGSGITNAYAESIGDALVKAKNFAKTKGFAEPGIGAVP